MLLLFVQFCLGDNIYFYQYESRNMAPYQINAKERLYVRMLFCEYIEERDQRGK